MAALPNHGNAAGKPVLEIGSTPAASSLTGTVAPGGVYLVKDSPTLSDGVSLLNFGFVILVFVWSLIDRNRDRRHERSLREEDLRRGVTAFWTQELICRTHMPLVESFFGDLEQRLQARRNLTPQTGPVDILPIVQSFEEYKTKHHEVSAKFVQPLRFVHPSFDVLADVLDEIEDFAALHLATLPGALTVTSTAPTPSFELQQFYKRFLQTLFEAQRESLGLESNPPTQGAGRRKGGEN